MRPRAHRLLGSRRIRHVVEAFGARSIQGDICGGWSARGVGHRGGRARADHSGARSSGCSQASAMAAAADEVAAGTFSAASLNPSRARPSDCTDDERRDFLSEAGDHFALRARSREGARLAGEEDRRRAFRRDRRRDPGAPRSNARHQSGARPQGGPHAASSVRPRRSSDSSASSSCRSSTRRS